MQTNIVGVLRVAVAFLPALKGRPGSTFMATSSAPAFVPRADFPAYRASEASLHPWLRSLRHQLRGVPVWAERDGRYDEVFAALNPA